ncbi:MAG: ABC transporter permease, partial [Myxococcota bacterium]|nr:ABC transporter permease [Myxococcota bacterium]
PSDRSIRKSLAEVGLTGSDALKMPGQLSGGMLRRASLAQVLAQGRPVIILDEPFVGLDDANALEIVALIRNLMEHGQGFILISHDTRFSKPLVTPGREVEISAQPAKEPATRKRATPHWNFAVRTGIRFVDYFAISAPMIIFAFVAAGMAISMLFADLLQATSVESLKKQLVEPNPSLVDKLLGIQLFKEFVGDEFSKIAGEHLPAIRRRIFALGISRGFVIELGPLLTALLLAGRIGGSYAGEVSMMQATNQNQLLRTLGISPRRWSLGPAAIAAMLAAPLLTAIGVGTSLLMAELVALNDANQLFESSSQYWQTLAVKTLDYQSLGTFPPFVCFYHSLVFMFLILVVAEIAGRMRPNIQPRDVPKAITWAVVGASLAIIAADWGLSRLFFYLSPLQQPLG